MATVLSTLYPPLIDTFMPAFPNEKNAIIHFTISPYNSSYEIKYLHVTLVNQSTNKNAFAKDENGNGNNVPDGTQLINGVWIIPFSETINGNSNEWLTLNREANYYTLSIPPQLLKQNQDVPRKFVVNQYYKVQLRFDKFYDSSDSKIETWSSNYLTEKRAFFSEWSSICLIKAIPTITVHLNNFTMELDDYYKANPNTSITNINSNLIIPVRTPQYMPGIIPIAGNLTFEGYEDSGLDKKVNTEYYQRDIRTTSGQEYLSSYVINIYDDKQVLIKSSGKQYVAKAEKTNNFYWLCDLTQAETGIQYTIELNFTTNNQYEFTKTFNFTLIDPALNYQPTWIFDKVELPYNGQGYAWKRSDSIDIQNTDQATLATYKSELREDGYLWYEDRAEKVLVTSEDGWVTFSIKSPQFENSGFLFVKRATSFDNFQEWEIIDCVFLNNAATQTHTVTDKTVGSLVQYKYSCQFLSVKGNWSNTAFTPEIVYPDFHDILISRGNRQLAIRYNAQIGSMTPVISRTKIDTLGGRYPKFAENAKLHYKQFQLSGMIIAESDYNRKFLNDLDFASEMAMYDNKIGGRYLVRNDTVQETGDLTINYETEEGIIETQTYHDGTYSQDIAAADTPIRVHKKYSQVNTRHDIYPMDNWWWERKFREEAIEWLNDGEPKLYRSMTEGNLIVMLDGITLTPNAQLGRRVWNFSCTVYEVEDGYSLTALNSLGIYHINNDYSVYVGGSDDSDYSINIDTTEIKQRVGQRLSITASEGNSTTIVQPGENKPIRYITNNEGLTKKVEVPTIGEEIGNFYQGLVENYDFNMESVRLRDLRVQFESLPQWYDLDAMAPEGTISGGYRIIITDEEGKQVEKIVYLENGVLKVKDAEDSYNIYSRSGMPISAFLSDWEAQNKENESTPGNGLFRINLDTGESLTVDAEKADEIVSAEIFKQERERNNYGLGYKLTLSLVSPHDPNLQLSRTIFVNQKGYYQVPSNLIVKEVTLYDGATATLDYLVEYDEEFENVSEPNSYEAGEKIVGQVSGEWDWNTAIHPIVEAKYYAYEKDENGGITQQSIDYWTAMTFDGTPYTILNLRSTADNASTQFIVGRTGVLNLQTDYPTASMYINGKRMIQAPISRQDYLDEWEYVIDQSVYSGQQDDPVEGGTYWWIVYNDKDPIESGILVKIHLENPTILDDEGLEFNIEDAKDVAEVWYTLEDAHYDTTEILEPKPNTIYGVINTEGTLEYKIYYLDWGWFNVEFPNARENDYSIAYARVPVYGMIEYRATILKKFWDPTS